MVMVDLVIMIAVVEIPVVVSSFFYIFDCA